MDPAQAYNLPICTFRRCPKHPIRSADIINHVGYQQAELDFLLKFD